MRQLIVLQEYMEEHADTPNVVGDDFHPRHNEKSRIHHASETVVKHLPTKIRSRRHKLSDEEKNLIDAIQDLSTLLRLLKHQKSSILPSTYVTYVKLGNGEFRACKAGDLEFPGVGDIHEDLFKQV